MHRSSFPSEAEEQGKKEETSSPHEDLQESPPATEETEKDDATNQTNLPHQRRLSLPFDDTTLATVRSGEWVWLEGSLCTLGVIAGKRLLQDLAEGKEPPLHLTKQSFYLATPSPAPFGKVIGSLDPEIALPTHHLVQALFDAGARSIIGYGPRQPQVIDTIKRKRALYLITPGTAGALLSGAVLQSEVIAYPELGLEAIRRIKVSLFPALVAIDAFGRDLFAIRPNPTAAHDTAIDPRHHA
jgi:fumarate hydratase subunit beta